MSIEQPPSGQPQRNSLRAALERFGRERGQPQPRLYRTVDEEREFREAKEKYGLKDHWPQGQPQSSTAASADEVERRRRADSTAIEQGQPQQEPATDEGWGPISRYSDLVEHMRRIAAYGMDVPESGRHLVDELLHEHGLQRVVGSQERQAGGHVQGDYAGSGYSVDARMWLCSCDAEMHSREWWDGWEARGVADAAASSK